MRFAIYSLGLFLLAGCASSTGGTATGTSGLGNSSQSLFVTGQGHRASAQAPRTQLRGPRAMRGLRGLRAPTHNRFAANGRGRSYGNAEPSVTYMRKGNTVEANFGGFGFQKVDRSFWLGPGQGPLNTAPHTVGQTGQTQTTTGGVVYDPVTRTFRYNER